MGDVGEVKISPASAGGRDGRSVERNGRLNSGGRRSAGVERIAERIVAAVRLVVVGVGAARGEHLRALEARHRPVVLARPAELARVREVVTRRPILVSRRRDVLQLIRRLQTGMSTRAEGYHRAANMLKWI